MPTEGELARRAKRNRPGASACTPHHRPLHGPERIRHGAGGKCYPVRHGGTRRCRPTNIDGLPTWIVGRDLCVPPLACTFHFPRADGFHPVGRGLAPAAGGGYPARCWLMAHAVHPVGAAARTMAIGQGLRHLRMALWDAGGFRPLRRTGVSRRARRGYFARCDGRPKALPLETAIF